MSLIKCPECGKEISSNAVACPNCGNPVPKKKCPIYISRKKSIMVLVKCNVSIDGVGIGKIACGNDFHTEVSVGTHYVTVESLVNGAPGISSVSTGKDEKSFTVTDSTRRVDIIIGTKASWIGGSGYCVIDSINCY